MTVEIGGRLVGPGEPPYVIAEAGVNHGGNPEVALRLVDAAADAGADAVKFQTFVAGALAAAGTPQAAYQVARAPAADQRAMLEQLELPVAAWSALHARAVARGIAFLSTPFDRGSVQLLAKLGVPAFKVGSGDLTNLLLLRALAAHRLPLIVSTGMATLDEVDAAVADLRSHGDPPLVLLQCTSAYPAADADANLRAMSTLRARYGVPVGYSDHTIGTAVATAAAALGADVIEKHLTLDRLRPGPDHAISLEPTEFGSLAAAVRAVHQALGDGTKAPVAAEEDNRGVARRGLVARRALDAGMVLAETDLDALRPASGVSPLRVDEVIGRRVKHALAAGAPIRPEELEPPLDH